MRNREMQTIKLCCVVGIKEQKHVSLNCFFHHVYSPPSSSSLWSLDRISYSHHVFVVLVVRLLLIDIYRSNADRIEGFRQLYSQF